MLFRDQLLNRNLWTNFGTIYRIKINLISFKFLVNNCPNNLMCVPLLC